MSIQLIISGPPRGKGRPRFARATGRVYTPNETRQAEQDVLSVWLAAGQPHVEGPVCLTIEAVFGRPRAHLRIDGTLTAKGQREQWPTRLDLDNIWKLTADALRDRALGDDRLIVSTSAWKRWTHPGEAPHIRVEIVPAPALTPLEAAVP